MQTKAGAALIPTPTPDEPDAPQARTPRPRRKLFLSVVAMAAVLLTADQLSKNWAVAHLDPDRPQDFLGSVLRLHLTFNPGAAFSIATGATWVLTLIASVVVLVTIITARRLGSWGWTWALGLLLGGALGNLSDRIFRGPQVGRGHVVDFLELPRWPIFNLSDMAIVTAAVLIAVLAFRGVGIDGSRERSAPSRHTAVGPDDDDA